MTVERVILIAIAVLAISFGAFEQLRADAGGPGVPAGTTAQFYGTSAENAQVCIFSFGNNSLRCFNRNGIIEKK